MKAIDNSQIYDYAADQNLLNSSLAFAYAGGSGYTSAPTVAFTAGGGTGAAATAVISNGRVVSLNITNGGSGYTSAPTVAFTGGGGTGATATAVITGDAVTSATVTSGGTGGTLTVTDNTTYPSGDSRKAVNISVFDKFGKEQSGHIGTTPDNVVIDLLAAGINSVDGLDVLATVVSENGKTKDGSARGVGANKASGTFTMEH
jgi:hypothetical protein